MRSENILDEMLLPFYRLFKHEIHNYDISDVAMLLRTEYVDILNAIFPNKKNILPFNDSGKYYNGGELYKYDKQTKMYTVWSYEGDKICEATIKNGQIETGFGVTSEYNTKYSGSFIDGEKSGKGIEIIQDTNHINPSIKEGFWKDGVLWNGSVRNFPAGNADVDVVSVSTRGMGNPRISDYDVIDGVLRNEKNIRDKDCNNKS